ncbi:CobD/CbiB family cobalamin biosynthesis protein, partial [Pelomonas sp. KK5]|uniref:CobD/CbiB family cobalamin biosynthesis protein n=1 Tax=Pelomonas sp. KK5 TaxID=1855730 RepID=UPI00117C0CDD
SLDAGRQQLARLVSRDTTALAEAEVREAAIETLAENLNDSVIAPLFWFAVAGLPGAAIYRFANTADAMWGYRDRREWSGKWAARADDLLSWLPARLTGLLLYRRGPLRREAARTPSPNSGWPMAAVALHLGLRLAKPGVYTLNAEGRAPQGGDVEAALRCCARALMIGAPVLMILAEVMR